ncbi:uncharacterized protein LOC113757018 isoform X1 [Coffea eugenioides]|uniref:uncharacterized protein LOC113757018 isoform X1 n=1 Tax=Coffea eugenioides TaxID=49369 RepID=UPI000F60670A|nr:uncharacterized protein LOC113757018 isoform X1 [Coffea eugenioides]
MGGGEGKRNIKIFCPSVSKIIELVAWDEQRLDLGSIARAFGLEPNTLKLNGHFISRGVDLIACSVTWKSLLSFFSSRGLSTGTTDSDALIVDGKLSKLGSKRKHDLSDLGNGTKPNGVGGHCKDLQLGHIDLFSSKRSKDGTAGFLNRIDKLTGFNCLSLKRKLSSRDTSPLKRTRVNETKSGLQERNDGRSQSVLNGRQFSCSIAGNRMKRLREDNLVLAAPHKRLR